MGLLLVLGFVLLLLLLLIGAGVMLFDLAERREEDAEWLQAKVVDQLRRDPVLSSLQILPVVHVPSGKRAPVSVELSGEVPSEATRGAVHDIVQETARKRGRQIEIDDRLAVRRPAGARAA
ncbi:MAG: hypothetical protein HYR51_17510 [Candidatus Rokubacteria bacterium]|nr:hypothetical protein [Candidatus Rokubacteria bacterium]